MAPHGRRFSRAALTFLPVTLIAALIATLVAPGAEAQATNRFVNPEFDGGLAPWGGDGDYSTVDADDCAGSGSADVSFFVPFLTSHVAQCVEVTAGEVLHAAVRAKADRLFVGGAFRFLFRSEPGCGGVDLETIDSTVSDLELTWATHHGSVTVPASASSAGVLVVFGSVLVFDSALIWADRAWLGDRPLLFYDGFENNLTCRWSDTIPHP